MKIEFWGLRTGVASTGVRGVPSWIAVVALGVCSSLGCGAHVKDDTGTETHWLKACDSDDECGGLACLCNVCTRACSEVDTCPNVAPHCVALDVLDCSASQQDAVCYGQTENELIAAAEDAGGKPSPNPVQLPVRDLDTRRPDATACDAYGWCWESPGAPGERFLAFSADGEFAVGERGVVFSMFDGYLDAPSVADLTSVVVVEGLPWVAAADGVWNRTSRGWNQSREVAASELAVTPDGGVWALGANTVARWDGKSWVDHSPSPQRTEMLFLYDLFVADDGTLSIAGGYFVDKSTTRGVVFTWDGSAWQERVAGFATGALRFLDGATEPYVYNVQTDDTNPVVRLYDPSNDWQVVAEREAASTRSVFWGPDGELWLSSESGVYSFDGDPRQLPPETTCGNAVTWDSRTIVCADDTSGLTFVTATGDGRIEGNPGWPTFPAYVDSTFGTQPTPVWAQTDPVWARSVSDVWRAPLDHSDGRDWTSMLEKDDTFSAHSIAGSASDDVWFAGETELRHWDGEAVRPVELPTDGAPARIISLHVLDSTHVWTLLQTTTEPTDAMIASFDAKEWTIEHHFNTGGATIYHGRIVGSSLDNLWATFGYQIYRGVDGVWTPLVELDAAETIVDAATDGEALWLLSDHTVLRLDGTVLTSLGHRPLLLDRLAVTDDAVWNFSGPLVRKLPR